MAFSLASMAEAAVEGIRDAAAIVKSYQDTDENKARLTEFLGHDLDGSETGGKKKASLKITALKNNKYDVYRTTTKNRSPQLLTRSFFRI